MNAAYLNDPATNYGSVDIYSDSLPRILYHQTVKKMQNRAIFINLKVGVFLNVSKRILKNQLSILNLEFAASEESVITFHLGTIKFQL